MPIGVSGRLLKTCRGGQFFWPRTRRLWEPEGDSWLAMFRFPSSGALTGACQRVNVLCDIEDPPPMSAIPGRQGVVTSPTLPAMEVRSTRRVVPGRRRARAYRRSGEVATDVGGAGAQKLVAQASRFWGLGYPKIVHDVATLLQFGIAIKILGDRVTRRRACGGGLDIGRRSGHATGSIAEM